jgi:hypothetical protein
MNKVRALHLLRFPRYLLPSALPPLLAAPGVPTPPRTACALRDTVFVFFSSQLASLCRESFLLNRMRSRVEGTARAAHWYTYQLKKMTSAKKKSVSVTGGLKMAVDLAQQRRIVPQSRTMRCALARFHTRCVFSSDLQFMAQQEGARRARTHSISSLRNRRVAHLEACWRIQHVCMVKKRNCGVDGQ